jgi:hypothetical protein
MVSKNILREPHGSGPGCREVHRLRTREGSIKSGVVRVGLFGTGVVLLLALRLFNKETLLRHQWEGDLALFLFVLYAYVHLVYPHIRAEFGGGVPAQVVLYLKDSAPLAHGGQVLETNLIDENEHGFYVTQARDSNVAYFVSREQSRTPSFSQESQTLAGDLPSKQAVSFSSAEFVCNDRNECPCERARLVQIHLKSQRSSCSTAVRSRARGE